MNNGGIFLAMAFFIVGGFTEAETLVESSMDWSTGMFSITATRPLDPGMSPSDHPRAIGILEQEIAALTILEIGNLTWDYQASLADLVTQQTFLKEELENTVLSMQKQWSRLSLDRKSVEAKYILNLSEALYLFRPEKKRWPQASRPIAWVPVPDDPWSGIVIYVPSGLPLRGTGLATNPVPALRPRILNNDLELLAEPSNDRTMIYHSLDETGPISDLVGQRPYRSMARALYGEIPCDIILSEYDTKRILAAESGRQALAEGKIVILLDSQTKR